ncbi:ExeM/NucH family extracellular endonuclease [Corynebacterium tapiri]|uniref:ExeM/NucH family extracellular endonuclease n=1 Tax=Corynebacterium tapiri TaxID=1448266 RepID=UPI001FE7D33A|nr:ExeM/NucH family extracellular endonuclease [Corynebacterium tapiri]
MSLRPLALAVACGVCTPLAVVPTALAAPAGTVVISEVYGGGGNSGSVFSNDFVELFNPTDQPIDLKGWTIDQQSAAGNTGKLHSLTGTIPAGGYYLIQGAAGANPSTALPAADEEGSFNFSGTKAVATLLDASGNPVDLVGWGDAAEFEGAPAVGTSNKTSIQRTNPGADTDNNQADFVAGAPTPQGSGSTGPTQPTDPTDPTDPTEPVTPVEPGAILPISEIQGTGETTPFDGKVVTTEGIVTAVYNEGGKDGFIIQTAGTPDPAATASSALFVYLGSQGVYPTVGQAVTVTGTAGEHYGTTQLKDVTVSPAQGLDPVTPLDITVLPAEREPLEHMLLNITGQYTVTDNYQINSYGEVGLVDGTTPLRQPTDVVTPGAEATAMQAENDARRLILDDGRTRNYSRSDQQTPLPYLIQNGGTTTAPLRVGDGVDFAHPVVLDFDHDQWRLQPTQPVTGNTNTADLPITWQNSREAELSAMDSVAGDTSIAAFNVLNYFTTLGEDVPGCDSYTDSKGAPVTARNCDVRGAYSQQAFEDQQRKIVAAINRMNADVVSLSEIENTATVTGDVSRRDESLAQLVDALNAAAGEQRWAYAKSPATLPASEDAIRVAFIYNPAKVEPVGESRIFDDGAFTGTARQPLAQQFKSTQGDSTFVAVANHFKSKGSVAFDDKDTGDGQGNNANLRVSQAKALLSHLNAQSDWADQPVFILGDLNSYSQEDSVKVLEEAGFANLGEEPTYLFGGQQGSLDHALANPKAQELVADARVWNINADESIAFEYSRRNYNAVDVYDDSPFRSSDHDPIKVGLNLGGTSQPAPEPQPQPQPEQGQSGLSSLFGSSSLPSLSSLSSRGSSSS